MRKLFALFLVACGGAAAVQATTPAPTVKAIASASASAKSSPSASIANTAVDAGPPPVDLLWTTKARIAVSSRVDNDADRPEHLVDHKPETAWNGKTGNLVGAWIKFEVPADTNVDHALLTVGFDKTTAKGEDLFTENHRITKVRVWRAGKQLRDVALDANDRKPQKIAIGTPGGEFQLEVLEVTPGTKSNWKEIAVSELAVMGTPGAERKSTPSAPSSVWVGSYDMKELGYDEDVAQTYLAACLAWAKAHDAIARKAREQLSQTHEHARRGLQPYLEFRASGAYLASDGAPSLWAFSLMPRAGVRLLLNEYFFFDFGAGVGFGAERIQIGWALGIPIPTANL